MSTYPMTRAVSKPAGVDRILVNGVDITRFRGKTTPTPPYKLYEPFGYGSATLTVPQVTPYLEAVAFGTGELSWAKKGAFVVVQRVDRETGDVIATDYRGRVIAIKANGPALVLEVGGILSGQAELRNKQVPVYRKVKDIGIYAFDAVENSGNFPGCHFEPRLGPTTGIEIVETGGMTHLGWLQHLCSMAVRKNGDQWTIMPREAGGNVFEMRLKDRTTKHCTVWLDDSRAVGDLTDDASESFNTGFGTGQTEGGMLWDGTVLPRIEDAAPPAFPGTLSVGSSGENVQTLHWKLINAKLLDRENASSLYDDETADAVETLQDQAGLPVTGVVNEATWRALFDVDVIGWGLDGARIMPLVQRSAVRRYNYTTNGNVAGLNPDYDRNVLRVDRNVEFGAGVSEKVGRQWMKGQMARLSGKSWAGTITLNGSGAFLGEHNSPTTATADKVISARDIQPGWNLWLPNFDGGTLVHIAEVDVNPGPFDTVTLTVDTHYRDALELAEIIDRNRQSRRNPRREWVAEQRGSTRVHDGVPPFTDKAGINYRKIEAPGNTWTVFPIFAGGAGTLSKLKVVTDNAKAAFCMAIFAADISAKTLNRRIGNPFPVDKNGETVWSTGAIQDWFDQRLLMYAAGDEKQPCGYGRRKHTNDSGATTDAPLVGWWQDDASFGYVTPYLMPALWVAVYPDRDTVIQRGRMLWTQLEPGA